MCVTNIFPFKNQSNEMSKNHGMSRTTRNCYRPPRIIAEIIGFVVNSDKNCIEKMHSSHSE